jgi:hypothetical protein
MRLDFRRPHLSELQQFEVECFELGEDAECGGPILKQAR